jgi:hypothetical protein
MRVASSLVTMLTLAIMLPMSSHAAPLRAPGVETGSAKFIETATPRCGRHARYVKGYRSKSGEWIKGYCTPIGHH